jgi:transcription antitermination factor NusG
MIHDRNGVAADAWPWYAVHCQRFNETNAAKALEALLGIVVYLPKVRQRLRGHFQLAPFFPGYLFIRANFHVVARSKINAIPGVVRLVTFDGVPQAVPDVVIEQIRTQVSTFDTQGGLVTHHFQPGDSVRLKHGPFRGLEAAFLGPMTPSERVQVLIEFLGSLRRTDVHVDDLEIASAAPPLRQERRTRGKGRPIKRH